MWQKEYKKKGFYWGLEHEKGLKEVIKYARKGIALDLGAGEGRNSIFLAKNGFKVETVDRIKEGLEKCKKIAKQNNLPIKTAAGDIKKFKFQKNKYSLILAVNVLNFFKLSEIKKIISSIKKSLKKEGVFYLTVFSARDPAFKKCKKELEMIEKNTFYSPKLKNFRHFFNKKELLNLLKFFEILGIKEEKKKDTHHEKVHYHWLIRAIVKK